MPRALAPAIRPPYPELAPHRRHGQADMFKLSQETIAIVSVGATLAAIIVATAAILFTQNSNIRADIQAMRVEARADRAESQAAREAIRDEGRAERESLRAENRADREAWQAEMRALREDAGTDREAVSRLSGIVEQMRTAGR